MKGRFLFLLPLVLAACTASMRRTDMAPKTTLPPGGVSFRFRGDVSSEFRGRFLIDFRKRVKDGRFFMTSGQARYFVRVTMDPLDIDYRPIYFVVPPLLSYLGCPQGTVTRRFSVAVFSGPEHRLLGVRVGLVRRPFGLYYMIPSTRRRVAEQVLHSVAQETASFFVR